MSKNVENTESDVIRVSRLGSIWLISKIFGLFPLMSINTLKTQETKSNYVFCIDLLYTIAWIAIYLVSFGFAAFNNPLTFTGNTPLVCVVGNFIHIYIAFCTAITSYGLAANKGRLLHIVWQKIQSIDSGLSEFAQSNSVDFDRMNERFQNTYLGLAGVAFAVIIIYDNWMFNILYGQFSFVICFSYMFPYLALTLVILQFITIVNLILIRLKYINGLLVAMVNEANVEEAAYTTSPILNMNTIRPIFFIVDRNLNSKMKPHSRHSDADPNALHLHLNKMFALHNELVELCELSNEKYSNQIVVFVTGAFVVILFGLFFELKVLFWVWKQQVQMIFYASSYLYWSVVYACLIYALLNMCTRTRNEARESAFIVHKLMLAKPRFLHDDQDVDDIYYNKFKSFTLQLLHQKKQFHFHGIGLFEFDYTFIFSTVSAATAYLIVLMQFDTSDAQ